jgi:hypothetical protein
MGYLTSQIFSKFFYEALFEPSYQRSHVLVFIVLSSANIACRIFGAPLDEIGFDLLKGKLLLEIGFYKRPLHSVFTGIDIYA